MGWLDVGTDAVAPLELLNADSPSVRINPVRGALGGLLVNDSALADAVPGGPLEAFFEWYAALSPSNDVPAPPSPRPPRKPR